MNETPKTKSGWRILRWLFLIIGSVATFCSGSELTFGFGPFNHKRGLYEFSNIVAVVFLVCLFWPLIRRIPAWLAIALSRKFFHWLFTWRTMRRALTGLAILATLVAIFYTEEDWRGKRAWENCKRELETKGVVLDWDKFIPPPVPDDQNFFKASTNIALRFVTARDLSSSEAAKRVMLHLYPTETNGFPVFDNTGIKGSPLVVARLTILSPDASLTPAGTNLVFRLNDVAASDQIAKLIQKSTGQSADGPQGYKFSEMQLSNLVPAQIFIEANGLPSISDLENFIPPDTATNIGRRLIEATGDKRIFQVVLTGVHFMAAADYLKWTDQFEPDFDEIREALKRPYARIEGDYSQPYFASIPNFILMRSLAQTLASRVQCHLMLGQPEKALADLALLKDSRRILEGKPTRLVAAMIDVAISGLYVYTVADTMRLHAWQEPQLAAIQEQLKEFKLPPVVVDAFKTEQAASPTVLGNSTASQYIKLVHFGNDQVTFMEKIKNPRYLFMVFAPRGWVYQNMVTDAKLLQNEIYSVDAANELISPRALNGAVREVDTTFKHLTPYNYFASNIIPNFVKAWQTTAFNQTLANEAQIVCALERYKLANGNYPETLDALAPQFIEKIPHDIIGGQPLHYRRTDDGKFLLYSVGWNETDDGGLPGTLDDVKKGDWVWQYPQN